MRLQKYLVECSIASRRGSEKLINEGRVAVNGETATVGQSVDPESDTITFNGNAVLRLSKVYVVLNKPQGIVTTAKDTHDRRTVVDLITGVSTRIFPVGRLDMDVTGTLLLTNDGELTNRITHPRYEVKKVYHAWVKGVVKPETLRKLEQGVMLDDGMTSPAKARILKTQRQTSLIELEIHEGRKRIVKRMCIAVGHPLNNLQRISIGTIDTHGLQLGEWRHLHPQEVTDLYDLVGLSAGN